jgi:hypothetical protein
MLTALLYFFGQFDCGRHTGAAVQIPVLVAGGLTVATTILAARRFGGSPVLALVLAAPIHYASLFVMLMFAQAFSSSGCPFYSISVG